MNLRNHSTSKQHIKRSSSRRKISRTNSTSNLQPTTGGVNDIWFKLQTIIATIFVFSSFFASLIEFINIWSLYGNNESKIIKTIDCKAIMIIYLIFYHISKLSLYSIFIINSYTVFHGSSFQYSKKTMIICLLFIIIFCI